NIVPIRNESSRPFATDVHTTKNDLNAGGGSLSSSSSSSSTSLSSSHSATSSINTIAGNSIPGFSSAGNAIDRKGSLAIGKSMFYTEHPPNHLADATGLAAQPTNALIFYAHLLVYMFVRCRA
ncbi:hypothetical protein DOY81_006855, partial [Sarcophaga bullata]